MEKQKQGWEKEADVADTAESSYSRDHGHGTREEHRESLTKERFQQRLLWRSITLTVLRMGLSPQENDLRMRKNHKLIKCIRCGG